MELYAKAEQKMSTARARDYSSGYKWETVNERLLGHYLELALSHKVVLDVKVRTLSESIFSA